MIQPLLPSELGGIPLARGVRAGDWIFATGVYGEATVDPLRPLSGEPKSHLEARSMYARALEVLQAGGADFSGVLRTDQYFPDYHAVPFLHQARREACGNYIAPSTSVLVPRLLRADAGMTMDLVATRGKATPLFPDQLDLPSTSGFAPVAMAGDFVFVAGFLAAQGAGDLGGIAPEAKVPEGHLWKGNRIQLEADYLIRRKLIPALKGAGCALADVVKASVYLTDIHDVPAFNQVWRRHFGADVPATTFIPVSNPGLAIADARCEINLIACKGTKRRVSSRLTPVCDGHPVAVQAGDLLFFSGAMGAEAINVFSEICRAAGTSLENAVRIQLLHTDIADFSASCKAWQKRLPKRPLPISALQVPGPLIVPGATVQVDCWVYAGK